VRHTQPGMIMQDRSDLFVDAFADFRYLPRNAITAPYPLISLSFFTKPCPSSGKTRRSSWRP